MWYVRPAKPQISLRIHAVWSEPLLVAWIFNECYATDWTSFWVSKLKRRLHRLVWVYTCQNATLLEITCRFSNYKSSWYPIGTSVQRSRRLLNSLQDYFISLILKAFKLAIPVIFLLTVSRRYFFICVRRWYIALYVFCSLVVICWEWGSGRRRRSGRCSICWTHFFGWVDLCFPPCSFISFRFFFLWAYLWFYLIMNHSERCACH